MNKTIIHPTDFSECSTRGYEYALNLALKLECELLIVHAIDGHQMDSFQSGRALISKSKEIEDEAERKLKEIGNAAIEKGVSCRAQIFNGELMTELPDIIKKENPMLVVMGTTGAGSIGNMMFGSNTNAIIEYAKTTVLAIPNKSVYSSLTEIVMAADLIEFTEERAVFMNDLVKGLDCSLKLLYVIKEGEKPIHESHIDKVNAVFADLTDPCPFEIIIREHDEYIDGVETYIKQTKPELFAIVASNKNFIEKFLYGSLSEKLIYGTEMPLMVLPHKLS